MHPIKINKWDLCLDIVDVFVSPPPCSNSTKSELAKFRPSNSQWQRGKRESFSGWLSLKGNPSEKREEKGRHWASGDRFQNLNQRSSRGSPTSVALTSTSLFGRLTPAASCSFTETAMLNYVWAGATVSNHHEDSSGGTSLVPQETRLRHIWLCTRGIWNKKNSDCFRLKGGVWRPSTGERTNGVLPRAVSVLLLAHTLSAHPNYRAICFCPKLPAISQPC